MRLVVADKDLVSEPSYEVEEAEPRQRHQLSDAGPAAVRGHGRTAGGRGRLLPGRTLRRRAAVTRRRPALPLRQTKGRRRFRPGRDQLARSGVVHGRTEGLRSARS